MADFACCELVAAVLECYEIISTLAPRPMAEKSVLSYPEVVTDHSLLSSLLIPQPWAGILVIRNEQKARQPSSLL